MSLSQPSVHNEIPQPFNFCRQGIVKKCASAQQTDDLELKYYLDDDLIARQFSQALSSLMADMVDVAVAVYLADRLALRGSHPSADLSWKRRLSLKIPVRRWDVWSCTRVLPLLQETLNFLTEDSWEFEFCQRSNPGRPSERQSFLSFPANLDHPVNVGLFSGGLDSFAGTAKAIHANPEHHFVCVSGTPSSRLGQLQQEQIQHLRKVSTSTVRHVRVLYSLRFAQRVPQEPTRRSRGFLFLMLGAVAAICARANSLSVYENGIGAINLPYNRTTVDVANSKAVHPKTLLLFSRLVSVLTGKSFRVDNSCIFETKAEMVRHPAMARLCLTPLSTVSCDAFPVRKPGTAQCGFCTSCLLRRMALNCAGLGVKDVSGYAHELCSEGLRPEPKTLKGLTAMDWQVQRLKSCLGTAGSWSSLVKEFPDLDQAEIALTRSSGLDPVTVREKLVNLYERHCHEWEKFPAARWLRPSKRAA